MKETPDTSPQISMLTRSLSNATLGIDSPTISLGDGTGVDNATLYRSAANTLATPGAMLIENGATINGSIGGTAIVDEDDMASDSATKVPTQQSVKAYVDANAGGGGGSSDWG